LNSAFPQKFMGIHSAGSLTIGMGVRLFRSDIPEIVENQSDEIVVLKHQSVELIEPMEIEGGRIKIAGYPLRAGERASMYYPDKTRYWRSPFEGLEIGESFEPAILSKYDTRCNIPCPLQSAMFKWDVPQFDIDFDLLDFATHSIAEYLSEKIQNSGYHMRVLTKMESINRCTDIPGSNPIYRYSSPGFPWVMNGVGLKSELFRQDENLLFHIADTPNGLMLNHAVDQLISTCRRGERPAVVFQGALKDEPLKMKKIALSATRSITASPIDYTLAHRMYFHTASAACTSMFNELPMKIGINPCSPDWHQLYQCHVAVGDVGFDCDFKAWDATVPVEVMERLPVIYNRIYQVCDPNWHPSHDVVRLKLHSCMHRALVTYEDVILQMPGGQMTGQPQTALDNSLINWIYATYVYMKLARVNEPKKASFYYFMQNVRCSFYGDDNMISFHPEMREWFNFDTYSVECSKLGLTNAR
jgi:hypothetical protein